ncbi:MAG: response regulator [Verrucomicrobiota bacterium]
MPRPKTALIADDEKHVRLFAKLLLREVGITTVWEAADGVQAIELLNTHEPELLLLDINMPQMNGFDVLKELQSAGWKLPVVMLTAENSMKSVREASQLGAVGYILKHAKRDDALASLRDALVDIEAGVAGGEGGSGIEGQTGTEGEQAPKV